MVTATTPTMEKRVWDALSTVMDPEIPAVSVVEMGMIRDVAVAGTRAAITVLPTFTGCPAVPIIKEDVLAAVAGVEGIEDVAVEFSYEPAWTPDRISEAGRERLKEFGIAPPTGNAPVLITEIGLPTVAVCPYCGSRETHNENPFGPTPCRALYYCDSCRNPFEQFKPI
jgi:ring-1,2-phenylacetyl-CoA epoxidase subunit PaaD